MKDGPHLFLITSFKYRSKFALRLFRGIGIRDQRVLILDAPDSEASSSIPTFHRYFVPSRCAVAKYRRRIFQPIVVNGALLDRPHKRNSTIPGFGHGVRFESFIATIVVGFVIDVE